MSFITRCVPVGMLVCLTLQLVGQVRLDVPAKVYRKHNKETVIPVTVRFPADLYTGQDAEVDLTVATTAPLAGTTPPLRVINPFPSFTLNCNGRATPCALTRNLQIVVPTTTATEDPYKGTTLKVAIEVKVIGLISPPEMITQMVSVVEGLEPIYALGDYLADDEVKLPVVKNTTSRDNILTVYGTDEGGKPAHRRLDLGSRGVYTVPNHTAFVRRRHWQPVPISITAVPIRVRRSVTDRFPDAEQDTTFRRRAVAGLTTLGIDINLAKLEWDRYFASGKKSSHKFGIGLWLGPNVVTLDSVHTLGYLDKGEESRQLFVSTGLTLSYAYNNVSFIIIPAGYDWHTSTAGKKWVYDRKRWWGFGIAINPSIIAPIFNK